MLKPTTRPIRQSLWRSDAFGSILGLILLSLYSPASAAEFGIPCAVSSGVPGANGLGGLIIADRTETRMLRQAEDFIANKKYVEALAFLQTLLERDQDQLLRPAADDKSAVFRSMKSEVLHIIGHLPPDGREVYLRNTSPVADALLKDALEDNDEDKLATIARLYFHTPAGYEATYRIALRKFDNGEPMAAGLLLMRLQRIPDAAQRWEPLLSTRIALSFIRAGMPHEADAVLKKLEATHRTASLKLGTKPRRLFEQGKPGAWLSQLMKSEAGPQYAHDADWLMHRAGPTRNVILPKPESALAERWQVATVADPFYKEARDTLETELDQQLQSVVSVQRDGRSRQQRPSLPSRHPLVVGGKVFTRMLESVHAYDLETGDFQFYAFGWERALERITGADGDPPPPNATKYLGEWINQRLWDDGTFGRLSSDGRRLYSIEGTGFWSAIPGVKQRDGLAVTSSSYLNAYDLTTGKLVWEAGGPASDSPEHNLPGRFFLGPPMPMAGQLYCLADVAGEVQLNVLDAETGHLTWSQPLAGSTSLGQNIANDRVRRSSGVSVAYADGILVCPTDTGATVALDLTTRSLLWGFPSDISPVFQTDAGVFRGRNGQEQSTAALPPGWIDSIPTIYQDKVILTPRKSSQIHVVDLLTGKRIWEHLRGQGLYVAGVVNDLVIVVGSGNVQAWNVHTGKPGWKRALELPDNPSGRGLIVGEDLLLPAGEKLLRIDLKTGKQRRPLPAPEDVELGNLIVARGRLISQGIDRLDVMPFPDLAPRKAK